MSNHELFCRLFDSYYKEILGFALRRLPTAEDAADVANDVFVVIWRRIKDVPKNSETRLWIFGIARLSIANHKKGAIRRANLGDRIAATIRDQMNNDHSEVIAAYKTVDDALLQIPESEAEILQLSAYEGFSPSEISNIVDLPVEKVRKQLFNARNRIRLALSTSSNPEQPKVFL